MSNFKSPNEIIICEDHAEVIIESNKYGTHKCLINLEDVERVRGKVISVTCIGKRRYPFFRNESGKHIYLKKFLLGSKSLATNIQIIDNRG